MFGDVGQRLRSWPHSHESVPSATMRVPAVLSHSSHPSFQGEYMRSSRYASLTRLVIGASIIAGLFGTTASVALAASPVTFGILREESPHNGVQSIDQVYRDTDTIT